ncbi:MAG: hypothetical protein US88_C0022G0010, partial [Parcubacteria group bacterium GW2011_GWA2_38_27]
ITGDTVAGDENAVTDDVNIKLLEGNLGA